MKKTIRKISFIAIMLCIFQITLTAQPIGSRIKVGTDSHISYWDGVSAWIPVAPGLPGHELKFIAGVPTWVYNPQGITTKVVSLITGSTAVSGGFILSDGGAKISARGICWSTSPNPTITDAHSTEETDIGSFTSNLIGLNIGTTYHIRAYATNNTGTAYGNEIIFTTLPNDNIVYDIEGNAYDIITIGTQDWMKQNLKATHYKNGTEIQQVTYYLTWADLNTGAYRWVWDENLNQQTTSYGALYNWFTVNTGNLCPNGWHVPTDAEWTTLTTFLGGESIAGGKLKEAGLMHWYSPNTAATNESGFTALPAGYISFGGQAFQFGLYAFWWSSTEDDNQDAWLRYVGKDYINATRLNYDKNYGASVRCLRN